MQIRFHIIAIIATLRCSSIAHAAATEEVFTACHAYPATKKFHWNVRGEVGLPDLVASISEISCRPVIIGPHIADHGKVVIQAPDLISAGEAFHLFLSALETMGLTLEESKRALKVVDLGRGREVAQQSLGAGPSSASGEQFVLRLIRLKYARTDEIAELCAKMRSKEGDVTPYAAARALLVTDRASIVEKIESLVAALDVPQEGARLFTLPVRSQKASELSTTLEKVMEAGRKPGGKGGELDADIPIAIVPSDPAQLVVIIGTQRAFDRVAALALRLDPEAPETAGGRAHVIYLANTNAEEMAATLQQLGLGSRTVAAPAAPGTNSNARAMPLEGEVRLAADKVSNAMIVFSSASDFQTVRDLVAKLDIPRRQVYVEALILDLSVDKMRNLGLALHGAMGVGGGAVGIGSDQSSTTNSVVVDPKTLSSAFGGAGLSTGILGPMTNIAGQNVPSFGVVVQALEHSKDANVLSQPHLLTMDNTKASIAVGKKVMFQSGTLAGAAGGVAISYTPRDVNLSLDVTPHLNDSDSVRLEIETKIDDIDGTSSVGLSAQPDTTQRDIKTSVVVPDGSTVVLGGLEKESETETVDKIPFLGDIPVLGRLFQTKSKQKTKQDLLILLTPYVIHGPEDLRRIEERKEREEREFLERYSVFKDESAFERHVDFRRKRGLLAEIVWSGRIADEDVKIHQEAMRALAKPKPKGAVE